MSAASEDLVIDIDIDHFLEFLAKPTAKWKEKLIERLYRSCTLLITITNIICQTPSRSQVHRHLTPPNVYHTVGPLYHAINQQLELARFVDPAYQRHDQTYPNFH